MNMITFTECAILISGCIIITCLTDVDARAVSLSHADQDNDTRSRRNYTVAIFEDEKWPLLTDVIFQSIPNLNLSKPTDYVPLLRPGQFTVAGDENDDTREGEVFSHDDEDSQNSIDAPPNQTDFTYHTISEDDFNYSLAHPIPESDVFSYFPIGADESMVVFSHNSTEYPDFNFTGYPDYSHFSGYPESHHSISHISITTESGGGVLISGGDVSGAGNHITNQEAEKIKPAIAYTKLYFGHKLWYSAVLYAIFQIILTLVYHLSLLAKHYSGFPAALHEAAALNYS